MSSGDEAPAYHGLVSPRPSNVPALTPREGKDIPSFEEEANTHAKIELTLTFPEGDPIVKEFSLGDTVFTVKKFVHDTRDIPWKGMVAELEGKPMLDPLSLNDFKALKESKAATINIKLP
mmetsp:Transcript_9039/g.25345  ORF Transcript_9039/g.25345 Transcript_9039/m.25345 type:complete len:120 (+) Transcript_9039:101-460(+)